MPLPKLYLLSREYRADGIVDAGEHPLPRIAREDDEGAAGKGRRVGELTEYDDAALARQGG